MAILPTLHGPGDLRGMSEPRLAELAEEIRRAIISTVATTGGHLGSSLGVVEITLALHRILESPRDRIVWDTGHQAYPHKLLTGATRGSGRFASSAGSAASRAAASRTTTSSTAATRGRASRSRRGSRPRGTCATAWSASRWSSATPRS